MLNKLGLLYVYGVVYSTSEPTAPREGPQLSVSFLSPAVSLLRNWLCTRAT